MLHHPIKRWLRQATPAVSFISCPSSFTVPSSAGWGRQPQLCHLFHNLHPSPFYQALVEAGNPSCVIYFMPFILHRSIKRWLRQATPAVSFISCPSSFTVLSSAGWGRQPQLCHLFHALCHSPSYQAPVEAGNPSCVIYVMPFNTSAILFFVAIETSVSFHIHYPAMMLNIMLAKTYVN